MIESELLLKLYQMAEPVAKELGMTPAEWMHRRVDHIVGAIAESERPVRRKHLRLIANQ